MLLQELFQKLSKVDEARRNPGQNERLEGHAGAAKFLETLGRDVRDYGVSMTTIPKLGINPGSKYNTPVGIYFYPAEYYLRKKGGKKNDKLDFQDNAPFIQIFEMFGDVEYIDEINSGQFNSYVTKLFNSKSKVAQLLGKSESSTEKFIANAVASSLTQAREADSYGGRLWYILYSLSKEDEDEDDVRRRDNAAPRSSVVWNSLLRLLGMNIIIDNGSGIIHPNEPTQGVVLDPRNVKQVRTVENTGVKNDVLDNQFINLANMKVNDGYIGDIVSYIRDMKLVYTPKYRKYTEKIVNNILGLLRKTPGIYTRLSMDDINVILQINKKHEVIKELIVGLYTAKFPKVKKELEEMIEEWEYTKSQATWAELPDNRKERHRVMIAPPYKQDQVKKMIRDLSPFKSEPATAEIINYSKEALARLQ